jgi:hypothetical protein
MRGAKQLQIVVMSAKLVRLRVRWIDWNRLTNGFSKKLENHQAAVALWIRGSSIFAGARNAALHASYGHRCGR